MATFSAVARDDGNWRKVYMQADHFYAARS